MSKLNPKLPQALQETLEQYYSAPAPRPEFAARLEAQLRRNVERRQVVPERMSFMKMLQTRPLVAMLLALLILLALSGVAYAIGKVTGYIPGVGIVDQSVPLRILTEPVVAERDGLTITVSQVVADSDRTFIAYTIDGLFWPTDDQPMCSDLPSLQLPDGYTLNAVDGGMGPRGGRMGYPINFETTINYPPIPADVSNITFTFPCIVFLPEGTGPENWQIPLKLSPAPKDYATPGVEIGATFVASNPEFATTPTPTFDMAFTPEPCESSFPNGSGLYLDKVIELPDSYILVGSFTDAGDLPGGLEISDDPYDNLPEIKDAAGNTVAFKVRDDIQPETHDCYWVPRYWAYEIAKPVQGPLTMTLDQIKIGVDHTTQFNFDTGSNPQIGQVWQLNLPVHAGQYEYIIDSVEMIEDGYLFNYHSSIDVPEEVAMFFDIVGNSSSSSIDDHGSEPVLKYSLIYPDVPPTGQLTVEFSLYESVPLQGPWTLTWIPPSK
ncbi:MAG TPA: DUF4179 domain-containing protein [Anaerolineales bacterium]|nr:DUF4179 domain-containing protein [Anaerolineales bacterium]